MNNNRLFTRACLWCQSTIAGRADKRFCTNSCKAHYRRASAQSPSSLTVQDGLSDYLSTAIPAKGHLWGQHQNEYDDEKWDAILEQAESVQAKQDPLHVMYAQVIGDFLRKEEKGGSFYMVEKRIAQTVKTIRHYLQHPGLLTSDSIAHRRLFDLYLVYDYLQDLRTGIVETVSEGRRPDGSVPCAEDTFLCIEDRHRRNLLINLLGHSITDR